MKTYVVLLRGINVGGKNILPMKPLKQQLEHAGFAKVRTYIQSGNIILDAVANPMSQIEDILQAQFALHPRVLVLTKKEFESAITNNPYPAFEGKLVHFYFCESTPNLNTKKLQLLADETEQTHLNKNVFYLYAPNGIARSKLVSKIETCLGVSATGRNLNTVNKLKGLLQDR